MRTDFRRVVVFVCSFLCLVPQPAHAQLNGLLVGAALDKLMDQVNTAIISARNAGNSVAIEAGREVAIAISNAKNAYLDSLNKTFDDHINPTIRGTIDQLQTAANDLTAGTNTTLQDATAKAQQVVNSLPFRQHEPQLTKFAPRFVVPSKTPYPVAVRVSGNFEYAAQQKFTPSLNVAGKEFQPVSSTTQELIFSIPASTLFPADPQSPTFQFVTATLNVPWESTSFLGLIKHSEKDSYRLYLGALPSVIGRIKFTVTTKHTDPGVPHVFTSSSYRQCSTRDCGNNDDLNHPYRVTPDAGCNVVRGTSHFNTSHTEGDWSQSFTGDDGNVVSFSVSTVHHGVSPFGHNESGAVNFTISFTEVCPHDVTDTNSQDVSLIWGDSHVLPATAGTWLVSFDSFDGHHSEYADSEATNAFLKVAGTVNSVTLSTTDPATLIWP